MNPPDLSGRPGVLLRRAHQAAVAIFAEEAGALSLTPPQHNLLTAIQQQPGCSQADLARIVSYDRATVGAVIAGLERRNLVNRHSTPGQPRRTSLTLTREGRKLLKAAAPITARINARVLSMLSPAERDLFIPLLAKVAFSRQAAE